MKKCFKCKIEKELTDFPTAKSYKDGVRGSCKVCFKYYLESNKEKRKAYLKVYAEKNKEKIKEKGKEYYKNNKEKHNAKTKEYYKNNKEKILEAQKEYNEKNKEKYKIKAKEWVKNNKEYIKEYQKKYHKEHKERDREKKNKQARYRYKTDPLDRIKNNLRSRTWAAFKNSKWTKRSRNIIMLGCSYETAKKHIERQFKKGMTWSNQGKWHIDHIIPLASANTEEELIKLCNYRNLQPLWAKDNLIKGAKIPNVQIQFKL